MSDYTEDDFQDGHVEVDENGEVTTVVSSVKVPTVETIKRRTIKDMKELGVHKPQYNRLVDIYSHLVQQYYKALADWEVEGEGQYETISAAGTLKTSPYVTAMEKLRKDILTYSDRLMLNPKSIGEEKVKESKQTKLGEMLSKLS